MLTVDGQRASYLALHDLAHEVCGGRWVALGGGGYAIVDVVPARLDPPARDRSAGPPLDPADRDPGGVARPRRGARCAAPRRSRMTDGREPAYRDWSEGYDPDTWLDRAVHETRHAVFPEHGLDPMP